MYGALTIIYQTAQISGIAAVIATRSRLRTLWILDSPSFVKYRCYTVCDFTAATCQLFVADIWHRCMLKLTVDYAFGFV